MVALRSGDGVAGLILEHLLWVFVETKRQEEQSERPKVRNTLLAFKAHKGSRSQGIRQPPDMERKESGLSLLSQRKPYWQLAHEVTLLYSFELLSLSGS